MNVRAYGLLLSRFPLSSNYASGIPRHGPFGGATITLFVQDLVGVYIEELDSERLHWLPGSLLEAMRTLGVDGLIGEGRGCRKDLEVALNSITLVNWKLVDPATSTVPRRNVFR